MKVNTNEKVFRTVVRPALMHGAETWALKMVQEHKFDVAEMRIIIIIIMAGMAVFYVAGYLIEERRRWPVITASPRGQCSK